MRVHVNDNPAIEDSRLHCRIVDVESVRSSLDTVARKVVHVGVIADVKYRLPCGKQTKEEVDGANTLA